jgi:Flp pilus assembly protein TadB
LSKAGIEYRLSPDQFFFSKIVGILIGALFRALPFYLDAITLAVESGASFTVAMTQASENAPESPLTYEFDRVLRDVRAGKLAMEAPVKMLGPLIMFIFPNTFAVLGFVILT